VRSLIGGERECDPTAVEVELRAIQERIELTSGKASAEEAEESDLLAVEMVVRVGSKTLFEDLAKSTLQVGIDDAGMDVVAAADGRGITEALSNTFHTADDMPFGVLIIRRRIHLAQKDGSLHGGAPGPKILRCERLARNFAEITVDVGRADLASRPIIIIILEQLVAGHVAATPHDTREARIVELDTVLLTTLSDELKRTARS